MFIISDGSTDKTPAILQKLSCEHTNLKYQHFERNVGKGLAISQSLKHIRTPFAVFCDVRQTFDRNAIKNLASGITDDNVGAVTGNLMIAEDPSNPEADVGLYWKYEKWIRDNESRYFSLIGVTGAIYMARTDALPKMVPDGTILDDMYIPMHMIKKGYTVKMANDAYAFDVPSKTAGEELARKIRTLAGNFQLVKLHPWMHMPTVNPIFFQWVSHKLSRLLVPYALLGVFVATSVGGHWLLDLAFVGQWFVILYGLLAYLASNRNKTIKFGSVLMSFGLLNFAALLAGIKYLTQPPERLWQKH